MRCRFSPLKTYEESADKNHGRIDFRKIETLPATSLNAELCKEWNGLAQIARITRTRILCKNKVWQKPEIEVAYLITSLAETVVKPVDLLGFNRNHWAIENNLHRNKDVLLGEDKFTNRTKNAPKNISLFLSMTLTLLIKINKSPKIAMEKLQDNKNEAIACLLWI